MFRNYLIAGLRNLVRNRLYAAINIVGLTIGFAAALLIALFVRDEFSYDKWLPNAGGIYMLTSNLAIPNMEPMHTNLISEELTPLMKLDFPGIDRIVRLQPVHFGLRHGDVELDDQLVYFADPDFFSVIQFQALAGDLKTALDQPDSLVVTLSAARKLFGKDAPIGELLELDRANPVKVTAVINDLPSNTQFNTEVILSARSQLSNATRKDKNPPEGWSLGGSYVYFTLKPGTSIEDIQQGLPGFVARHKASSISLVGPSPLDTLPMTGLHLQPAGVFASLNPSGNLSTVETTCVVGVLILFIAAVNFVNLSTARASRRAVEVGMRKAVGAKPADLVVQFIGESLIYVVVATLIAVAVVSAGMPGFNAYLSRTIAFHFWTDPGLLPALVGTMLIVGVLAGAYPAFVLSRFRPTVVLKSGTALSNASGLPRSVLVALQFAILTGLILVTFVVYRQTSYALGPGVRLDTERVYVMARGPSRYSSDICSQAMEDGVRAVPGVAAAACSDIHALGVQHSPGEITLKDGIKLSVEMAPVDYGFFELYGIKPVAGRLFQRDHADQPPDGPGPTPRWIPPEYNSPIIVNETLARKIGAGKAGAVVGQVGSFKFGFAGTVTAALDESEIIAVVPNFTADATHVLVAPTFYFMMQPRQFAQEGILSVKLRADADVKATLDAIDKVWKDMGPTQTVSRFAMKDYLVQLNADIILRSHVFTACSVIAIFVAALGLFGLSAFTAERRTKEIGIRKAMGASKTEILQVLLWQFTKPVLWANLIAWPVAGYFMRRWLEGFAYHIDLQPWMFLAASALALAIAVLTVLGHALLVARAKPVAALRYE